MLLEEALDKARAWEAAGRQATSMSVNPSSPQVEGDSVNADKTRQGKEDERSRKCYNWGREGHLARDRNCLSKGKCDDTFSLNTVNFGLNGQLN